MLSSIFTAACGHTITTHIYDSLSTFLMGRTHLQLNLENR